jgi:hypothetical protein
MQDSFAWVLLPEGLSWYIIKIAAMAPPLQVGDETLSVLEIWGAEYQENDCLLIKPEARDALQAICDRERCLMQVCDNQGCLRSPSILNCCTLHSQTCCMECFLDPTSQSPFHSIPVCPRQRREDAFQNNTC